MVKDSLGLDSRVLNGLVKYGLYFRVSEEVLRRLGGNWHSILYFFIGNRLVVIMGAKW